ncbi:Ig-like domain-containing protein [Nocardioides sp. 1609]|uniref:Ig-like domain-containing protein n=1 Tax=Nocardioides sp. 1609 TaxID=2508327 RepID=UPI00106F1E28|nr:Ig-like domain-containing protein [Nocardioides sp. 1609]
MTSLGVAAAGLAVLGGVATAPPARAAEVDVTNATFTWDLNNEATSGAFAPGTWNLMSAGRIGNPGAGGVTLRTSDDGATWSNGAAAGWSAQSGDVTVEDLQANGSYAPATFGGTRTNTAGANANTAGVRGETRFKFTGGTGTVDPAAGTASVAWDGDATLLFYSGMTFFHLSDPELSVAADGTGTVRATVGGYATSMDDPTLWQALPDEEVTVATLTDVDVTTLGVTTTPAYREVAYSAPASSSAQVTSGTSWGSFPQGFVDFQQDVRQGPYWYSTGGAADPRKIANELQVRFNTAPSVTVSDTDLLPNGSYEVTVEGENFDPGAAIGTRPPLAGRSGGTYVVFGKFADTWRPSAGAPSTSRKNTSQKWAVLAADMGTVGGPAAGAVELTPAGTFSTTVTVDKAAIDAVATDPSLVNYGVYTYPGSGAANAAFETYTPITFTPATPAVTVSAPSVTYGRTATATVTVANEGAADGDTVTLRRGTTTVGTAPLTAGTATFPLGTLPAGAHALTASFSGNSNSLAARGAGSLRVAKATSTTAVALARAPRKQRAGKAKVTVTSPTTRATGKVVVQVTKAGKVVRRAQGTLRPNGVVTVTLPQLGNKAKGAHQVVVTYAGTANVAGSTKTVRFTVG